eukprot:2780883-Ditylum_brightwellii.AAC.1
MSETGLFKLIDFDPNDDDERQQVDADAIIKEAWQNPCDADLIYSFSKCGCGCCYCVEKWVCPLYQALDLGLGVEVIDALITPIAIEQTYCGMTVLHVACQHGASLDVIYLLLNSLPNAAKKKDNGDWTPLHAAYHRGAS